MVRKVRAGRNQGAGRSEPDEAARLIEAAPSLKHKAALSAAYGTGLRVSEVARLKVSDIDRGRMITAGAAPPALEERLCSPARSGLRERRLDALPAMNYAPRQACDGNAS